MNTMELRRAINRCRSQETLREIADLCRARQDELRKQKREEAAYAVEQAWESVRAAKAGYVAVLFSGGDIELPAVEALRSRARPKRVALPAGTTLLVHAVQPRAKRVWLRNVSSGECYGMTPRELGLLKVCSFKDELTAHVALVQRGLLPLAGGESG